MARKGRYILVIDKFLQIDRWAKLARRPLGDEDQLENFQALHFGEFRHWYYRFFYHAVREIKPKIALEIGIDYGHTLVHMAAGNPSTLVIGIDWRKNCAQDMPKFPNVRLVYENSLNSGEIISHLVDKHGKIGLVFQDSSHHYNDSHKEFKLYSQFLSDGAIWACDDVMNIFHDPLVDPPGKSMETYFNELPGRKKLYKKLHRGSVIGVTIL